MMTVSVYHFTLLREDAVRLVFDNESIETTTTEGEEITIMGLSKLKFVQDEVNGGYSHQFLTNVDFKSNGEYFWSLVTLSSVDKKTYSGTISLIHSGLS